MIPSAPFSHGRRSSAARRRSDNSDRLVRLVIESDPCALVLANLEGTIVFSNPRCDSLFGYSAGELLGRPIDDLVPGRLRMRSVFETSGTSARREITGLGKKGAEFPIEILLTPVKSDEGPLTLVSIVDVTERNRVELALLESQANLAAEVGALSRLHAASNMLWRSGELHTGLSAALDAALDLLDADKGNLQLFDPKKEVLTIAVHRGFTQRFLDVFKEVTAAGNSVCGRSLRNRERIVVEDVNEDEGFAPYRALAEEEGFRAVQSTPLLGRNGRPVGMLSTHFRNPHRPSDQELYRLDLYVRQIVDFIERLQAEDILRGSEERHRILFEKMTEGFVVYDAIRGGDGRLKDFRVVTVNGAYGRLLRRKCSEVIGKTILEIYPGTERIWRDRYTTLLESGEPVFFQTHYEGRWFETRAFRVNEGRIACVFSEITDRKRLEEARLRLSSMIASSHDAIVSRALDGTVVDWNAACESFYGYSAEEMQGRSFAVVIPPGPYAAQLEEMEGRIRAGIAVEPFETIRVRKDGTRFPVSVTLSPIRDTEGNLIGISSSSRDITDRRRLEQELLDTVETERRRIGQELHDSLGQKLLGISFLCQALTEHLRKKVLPEAAEAEVIASHVEKATAESRELSRGLYAAELDHHGLIDALRELVDHINTTTEIKCHFVCDRPFTIADKSMANNIYRIAQEALHNARRHSMASEVILVASCSDNELKLIVKDNGVGIPEEISASGMGLKTMQYRAHIIGGAFQVSNADGGGTAVTCTVPLREEAVRS